VFTLLSDDGRPEILRALWTADELVALSDLQEATGIRDSGRFYHLDRLVGKFVHKTPDGYELTQAGEEINGAIEAGSDCRIERLILSAGPLPADCIVASVRRCTRWRRPSGAFTTSTGSTSGTDRPGSAPRSTPIIPTCGAGIRSGRA